MMCSRWHCSPGTARNAEGNTSHRDVPAHEVCKSGSRDGGRGGGGQRLAGNGIARPGPDHLIWEDREEGITAMERTRVGEWGVRGGEGEPSEEWR